MVASYSDFLLSLHFTNKISQHKISSVGASKMSRITHSPAVADNLDPRTTCPRLAVVSSVRIHFATIECMRASAGLSTVPAAGRQRVIGAAGGAPRQFSRAGDNLRVWLCP